MKKTSLLTVLMAALMSLTLISCGGDSKSGGGSGGSNDVFTQQAQGNPGNMATAEQAISNIRGGNFMQQSQVGIPYIFQVESETWITCSDYDEIYRMRFIDFGGTIKRSGVLTSGGCQKTLPYFYEDYLSETTLQGLATELADKFQTALSNHSLSTPQVQKVINGVPYTYYPAGTNCNGNYTCQQIVNSSTMQWRFYDATIGWVLVDFNKALIQNPLISYF